MKKKKIVLFVFLIVGVLSLILTYKLKQNNLNKNKPIKEEKLSIMIKEDGATEYTKSSSKDIPKGNYVLNEEKTHCENNGQITSYDSTTGTVSFEFIGSDKCYLYFDFKQEKIIIGTNELVVNSGKPDFTKVATTNEGIYAAEDDYTATTGMKSYYFRGAVDNNWVKFGKDSTGKDIYWRIIRINGDGSIRMIYTGTTDPKTDSSVTGSNGVYMTGEGTQISTEDAFNSTYNKAEYVGYMYTDGEQHGNSTASDIKTTIENWYAGTTLKDNSLVSQDQIFCNDRSVTSGTWSSSPISDLYYAPYTRLSSSTPKPQLKCPTESDKFTSKKSSIGNKRLEYPVGLITADEVTMAGGVYGTSNSTYYLYTNQYYWSGSPHNFVSDRSRAYEFDVARHGYIDAYGVDNDDASGTRPVISLSSKAKLTGDGTWNNVYEVMGYETILANNGGKDTIEAKGNPNFATVATTNEGMYSDKDDLGTSYYFRGAVDNNWVKFGQENGKDIYWRIIRINGDGSIRMIYSGTTDPKTDSSVTGSNGVYMTGEGTQISTGAFNSTYNKSEYVGYQYIEGEQHGYGECNGTSASCTVNGNTVYNSTIKQVIDKWYAGTTLETDAATKALVSQDQIFCNDRSASTTAVAYSNTNYTTLTSWNSTGTDYYYGAIGRLSESKSPILICPTASDKFTVGTSNGNGALTYPVGLITADEVAMAGIVMKVNNTSNSSYYLYTKQSYWSGSPYYFLSNGVANEFFVSSSGYLYANYSVNDYNSVRPVVSLSSKVKLSGNGTYSKPYTVS